MGLRKFKALGRMGGWTALGVVLAAGTASAQQAVPPTTNQSVPTPAPTPTPAPGTVGNPALQNFNLDGTVTREATPAPASAQPPAAKPAPASAAPSATTPRQETSPEVASPLRRADPTTESPVDQPEPSTGSVPVAAAPLETPTVDSAPVVSTPDLMPPPPAEPSGGARWPWLMAVALALGGAAAWWWRRQRGEAEALAFAGPTPEATAPAPAPTPVPAPAPAPRAPSAAFDGGIVSRALLPKLAFELNPLKFETDDKQSARLTFELVVVNVGSAPARDVRVEAKMFNAGPTQDLQILQFFKAPSGMGAELPPIAPRNRVPLRSRIGMTAADYEALSLGGRSLVVPMIAVNAVYRGAAGETQDSASWLVGALPPAGDVEKLRPFPLDRPVTTTALAARTHSAGVAA